MVSKLLVATDGSDTAWKAVKYAVGFAKQIGASEIRVCDISKKYFKIPEAPMI